LHDPTQRSAVPFCHGLLYAVRLGVIPSDLIDPDTSSEKIASLCVPCQGALSQRVGIPPGELLLQPEALGADQEVTNGLKHSEKRPFLRVSDPCGPQRAANVEQASKYQTWVPTHHNDGEGRRCGRRERQMHPTGPPG